MIQHVSMPIDAGKLYTLDQVKDCTGLGVHSLRRLRREGLPVRYVAGRAFVLGEDLLTHVREHGKLAKND
jgi:hypothetical protein